MRGGMVLPGSPDLLYLFKINVRQGFPFEVYISNIQEHSECVWFIFLPAFRECDLYILGAAFF